MFTALDERETKENLRAEFPTDRKPYANDHDYEDDSDLEEDEEEDILYDELVGAPKSRRRNREITPTLPISKT